MTAKIKILLFGVALGMALLFTWNLRQTMRGYSLDSVFNEATADVFYADARKISGKQALQVARLQQDESIERTSSAKSFWVDLPDVVVRVRAPVEYNFFVQLTDGWSFRRAGDEILVGVPELSNGTPAVDVGRLKFDVLKGSLIRDEKAVIDGLQSELMGLLTERGLAHRDLVRDQAREAIAGFVRGWLSKQTRYPVTEPIRVLFPGEDRPATKN